MAGSGFRLIVFDYLYLGTMGPLSVSVGSVVWYVLVVHGGMESVVVDGEMKMYQ